MLLQWWRWCCCLPCTAIPTLTTIPLLATILLRFRMLLLLMVAVVLLPAVYCQAPLTTFLMRSGCCCCCWWRWCCCLPCTAIPTLTTIPPLTTILVRFRMLLLLLVAVVLLPAVYCQPHSNYHPTSNYHSCAFQDAVVAVGGGGAVACSVLPGPRPHSILLLQAPQDRLREKGGPEPVLYPWVMQKIIYLENKFRVKIFLKKLNLWSCQMLVGVKVFKKYFLQYMYIPFKILFNSLTLHTNKKEIKFSSYIRKFRVEQLKSHLWGRAS